MCIGEIHAKYSRKLYFNRKVYGGLRRRNSMRLSYKKYHTFLAKAKKLGLVANGNGFMGLRIRRAPYTV